jgi:hypothetical protein
MLTLDLFNTRHEQELHEGAVDNTIARLIEPLSRRAADVRTQLRNGNLSPAEMKALETEYEDLVAKRLDIIHGRSPAPQDECMGYGSLGETDDVPVGRMQPGTPEYAAARNRSVKYAGLPDIADKDAKMARLNQPGKVGTDVVSPQQRVNPNPNKGVVGHAVDWLRGKGGPGKEGPTYESKLAEQDKPFELEPSMPETDGQAVYQQLIQAYKAEVPYVIIPFMQDQKQATLTKPSIFNALVALYNMNPNARKKTIDKSFSDFESFMLFVSRLKPYQYRRPKPQDRANVQQQTSPSPSPHPEPQQTAAPQAQGAQAGARQWEPFKDLSESAGQKKNSQEPDLSGSTARDPIVARELRKIRGRQPGAASDIEALVRDEIDQQARTEQQLAQQETEIDRQQQQLTQLVQANQTQSSEINSQGSEIDNLYKQLQQAMSTAQAQPAPEPKSKPKAEPQIATPVAEPTYTPPPVPAEVAAQDAEARAEIARLNQQVQQLQQASAVKPPDQQSQAQAQIDQLQSRIVDLEKERAERADKQKAAAEKRAKTIADKKATKDAVDQLIGGFRLQPATKAKTPAAVPALHETVEPGAEMSTNELLYRAAVEYMQQMGREGQAVDFETAVKLAARHYHIPYCPGMVPELYAKRAELDAKLATAIAAKQAERAGRKQRRIAQTAPTTPEQEKKMQDYWAKHAPKADRLKGSATSLEEGYYKNLDIERQERNLGPIYEVGRRKDGRWTPLKQYNDYAQAQTHAQNIKNKYPSMEVGIKTQDGQITMAGLKEGFQDFNKVEPYAVCLAGKPVKKFDYYEEARRFHDNWKKKLYREGNTEKADKITLMPLNLDEEEQKPAGWGEFPPKQEITIVPPKKLKSGQTYQDLNKYWQSQGQAPIYKTNEAGNPAQQAAIAIAMKKAGKKPKNESDDFDDGEWTDDPEQHVVVKAQQPTKYPESVLRAIQQNPSMRADIIADYQRKQGVAETALNPRDPAGDYAAKRKALQDLGMNKAVDQQAVLQRRLDLDREAKAKGIAEDTGSWIVYDPETKQIKKRFKTHTAGKSYARAHGLGFASSSYYFDNIKEKTVAEVATDYSKRRQRERDVDAGRPVKPLPKNPQTDYARKRAKDKRDMELGEESSNGSEAVEQAILRRIMVAHTDLLKQFGPEKVMQAAEEVAYNVGDVDEIGTSDVGAYVAQVKQILGAI